MTEHPEVESAKLRSTLSRTEERLRIAEEYGKTCRKDCARSVTSPLLDQCRRTNDMLVLCVGLGMGVAACWALSLLLVGMYYALIMKDAFAALSSLGIDAFGLGIWAFFRHYVKTLQDQYKTQFTALTSVPERLGPAPGRVAVENADA